MTPGDVPLSDLAGTEGGIDASDTSRPDVPSGTEPDAGGPNTTRPESATLNAPLIFSDENGIWSVTPDGQPKLIVARPNADGIHPSPFLDRLAITWQGQGTEIYDLQGQLLGWIPGDRFAGWTSNEAVVVDMVKWDIRGRAIHTFTVPTETSNPGGSTTKSPEIRHAAVSPDGQWLAVEDSGSISYAKYLLATHDSSKARKIGDGGLTKLIWSRGGDSVGLDSNGALLLNATRTGISRVAFPLTTDICEGQPWVSDSTFLVWTYNRDVKSCADPYVVDTAHPPTLVHFEPKTAFADTSTWDVRREGLVFAISPDRSQIAYRLTSGNRGIVIANPDGGDPRSLLTNRSVSSLAWDSPNPKALAFDSDKATDSKSDAGTVEATALPGPAGKPSTSTNCQQGVWYQRSPTPLPSHWPSPRHFAARAFDTERGLLVVDGGFGSGFQTVAPMDTTWEWNGRAGTWTNRSPTSVPRPLPRARHGMAYDSSRKMLVSTGDENIWNYDPASNQWSVWKCQNPSGAVDALFYVPRLDKFFVGFDYHSAGWFSVDPCAFETQSLPQSPTPVGVEFTMDYVFDSKRDKIWQVGGRNYGSTPLDVQAGWKSIPDDPKGPGLREYMTLAFDEDRGVLMMFSGMRLTSAAPGTSQDLSYPADLWEWNPDNSTWTSCSAGSSGPPARGSASMVYDPGRHALILFGGNGYDDRGASVGPLADLWEWAIP